MEKLSEMLHHIDCLVWNNGERFYSFSELIHGLKNQKEENLIAEDLILTPFYVLGGSRPGVCEFCGYELVDGRG